MVYIKQAMTLTLLFGLVAIVFTPNNVKTISIFIVRPKKINVLFPETSQYFLGSVGRDFLFF